VEEEQKDRIRGDRRAEEEERRWNGTEEMKGDWERIVRGIREEE
jgi:hypothetical protein